MAPMRRRRFISRSSACAPARRLSAAALARAAAAAWALLVCSGALQAARWHAATPPGRWAWSPNGKAPNRESGSRSFARDGGEQRNFRTKRSRKSRRVKEAVLGGGPRGGQAGDATPQWFAELQDIAGESSAPAFTKSTLIASAAKRGDWKELNEFLSQPQQEVFPMDDEAREALTAFWRRNKTAAVAQLPLVLRAGEQVDNQLCNEVLVSLIKRRDPTATKEWLHTDGLEPGLWVSERTVAMIVGSADVQSEEQAEDFMDWMLQLNMPGPNIDAYTRLFFSLRDHGAPPSVGRRWFRQMVYENVLPPTTLVNHLLNYMQQEGLEVMEDFLKEVLNAGIEINHVTYGYFLQQSVDSQDIASAFRWFDRMYRDGHNPDIIEFNMMLNAASKTGNVTMAEEIFHKFLQDGKQAPNRRMYHALLRAAAKSGSIEHAERWLKMSLKAGYEMDLRVYRPMIQAAMKAGRPWRVHELFEQMLSAGVVANLKLDVELRMFHAVVTDARFSLGRGKVKQLVDAARSAGLAPPTPASGRTRSVAVKA